MIGRNKGNNAIFRVLGEHALWMIRVCEVEARRKIRKDVKGVRSNRTKDEHDGKHLYSGVVVDFWVVWSKPGFNMLRCAKLVRTCRCVVGSVARDDLPICT